MKEKFDAIWMNTENSSLKTVFEEYISNTDKLHVIYQNNDGFYLPYSYSKSNDPQWRLPVWSQENDKAVMPSIESAKEYLSSFGVDYT